MNDLSKIAIETIRTLSMDAVQKANSGHPGTPMALAPTAFTLYDKFLEYDPANPDWFNRDRFVLSCGHASMLLYSILHLSGFDVSLDDIKNFRQLKSKTPGHPEYRHTAGVETTTGPLGQGAGNSVGMAIAKKWLAERFNKPGFDIISYNVITMVSDGDLMEGISTEAASIAGHFKLDDLIWIYDNNSITIDGRTDLTFSDDVEMRFKSFGWNVLRINDANDLEDINSKISEAVTYKGKPTIIILDSVIGYGSPNKQDTAEAHGSPLGGDEIKLTKEYYGLDPEKKFYVPEELEKFKEEKLKAGEIFSGDWNNLFDKYKASFPDEARELQMILNDELPEDVINATEVFREPQSATATRVLNGKVLNSVANSLTWLIGGSADLSESNNVAIKDAGIFGANNYTGRNIPFGIREHAMGTIANGMRLCKLRPFTATFLMFADYMRPAIRLAALMKLNVNFIFSHDSIGLGEDGPTHQPIEHLAALRAIPNLDVFRPADDKEVEVMWKYILDVKDRPIASILSRQKVPMIDRTKYNSAEGAMKGGYVIADTDNPAVILIGTGSELHLCIQAFEELKSSGINARVVSMPCVEEFDRQSIEYRDSVLPSEIKKRISVEAGVTSCWYKYVGENGVSIGLNTFGESAPAEDLYNHFGITTDSIIEEANRIVNSI